MATTPGSRRRETRTTITGDDDTLTPMQEPVGSMDIPGSRTSNINEVNMRPGETTRRTGNLGTTDAPRASTARGTGGSFTATFAIVAAILVAAFLLALYFGNNRSDMATGSGSQAPVADTTNGTSNDTTGSTTTPSQQTMPGTGDAGTGASGSGSGGTTTPPANP